MWQKERKERLFELVRRTTRDQHQPRVTGGYLPRHENVHFLSACIIIWWNIRKHTSYLSPY